MIEKDEAIKEGLKEKEIEEESTLVYSITSYGADYPIDGLVKRIRDESIFIPTFQRGFVWSLREASRFIESLLLGLPVPGIFLSREEETKQLKVIDGQQRLRTLQYFYDGIFSNTGKEFALTNISSAYKGCTYKSLNIEDKRRLDDSIIHATIVRQDEPSNDNSSIFLIFERLNTGGQHLHPQEIRTAIYRGEFSNLITELNGNKAWRSLYGPISRRMRDQELILRFFALYFQGHEYKKLMKDFLNTYMASNRDFEKQSPDQIEKLFIPTVETILEHLGKQAFRIRRTLIAALCDSIMIGIARRLENGDIHNPAELKKQYDKLVKEPKFLSAVTVHTSDEENVKDRINLAVKAFSAVK